MLRLACATVLIIHAIAGLGRTPGLSALVLQAASAGLGLLLVVGLWTPVAATLAAVDGLVNGLSHPASARYWLVAAICVALALLGPGAWSIDAKLFGWKRIDVDSE